MSYQKLANILGVRVMVLGWVACRLGWRLAGTTDILHMSHIITYLLNILWLTNYLSKYSNFLAHNKSIYVIVYDSHRQLTCGRMK